MGWVEDKAEKILGKEDRLSYRQARGLLSHRFRLDRAEADGIIKDLKRQGRIKF